MKKFSKVTGENINEAPVQKKKEYTPEEIFIFELNSLMNSHLKVEFLGNIDATFGGSMRVAGKDQFIGALLELIDSKTSKEKSKLLESLKSEITDWELIDSKIDQINEEKAFSILKSPKNKLKEIYQRYKDDEELFLSKLERAISKMKDGKTAFYRSLAAEEMSKPGSGFPNTLFKKVADKYLFKAKQLGYAR